MFKGMTYQSLEKQVGGKHYRNMKIQPAEFINENKLKGFKNNIFKKTNTSLDNKIKAVAKALSCNDRPLIHLGHGVKLSNCKKLFIVMNYLI